MIPEGTVYNAMGRINRISVLCIDAYGVAVKNGFKGTVDEWLASLNATDEQVAKAVADYIERHPYSKATIGVVELLANKWVGEGNLYSQVVSVVPIDSNVGVTENSQVDLTPSVEQLVIFYEKDLTFVTENEDGVVTVYAIGQKPTSDYTIQVTITEVVT